MTPIKKAIVITICVICAVICKDGLFEGCLYFKNKGNKLYMYVNLGEEDYDADEDYDEYLRIPNDIAKSLIPKLETK